MTYRLGVCPHCNGQRFYVRATARGAVGISYDRHGNELSIAQDRLWFKRSTTVRCEDCMKIRKDLICWDGSIQDRMVNLHSRSVALASDRIAALTAEYNRLLRAGERPGEFTDILEQLNTQNAIKEKAIRKRNQAEQIVK